MLHNSYAKVLVKKLCSYKLISKRLSALFINGPKATDNFVFVTPHVDFYELLKEKNVLQSDINKRNSKIDLNKLENLWSVYEELKNKKIEYDDRREEISKKLVELFKSKEENDVEKLKIQLQLLKENIKKLKEPLWSAEEAAYLEALKVPNRLHNLTPNVNKTVVFEQGLKPSNQKNHLKIGKEKHLINFTKNENYYLKGDAAVFELGAKFFISQKLRHNNYIQFSNPDFVKSLVIEGCGEDHTNSDKTFILHHEEPTELNVDNRLHLTGGSSLYSFFAYHAKNVLHGKAFPLKYFTMGRQYVPTPNKEDGLFNVSQSSVIQVFIATKNKAELDEMLNSVINITKDIYNQLNYHYRLSFLPAHNLNMWESLRLVIEMYSSSRQDYVEVGNVSLSGDFISKRLLFTYTEEKRSKFPCILSGTILNVPKLLACILEQDNEFVLPEQFKVENWCTNNV